MHRTWQKAVQQNDLRNWRANNEADKLANLAAGMKRYPDHVEQEYKRRRQLFEALIWMSIDILKLWPQSAQPPASPPARGAPCPYRGSFPHPSALHQRAHRLPHLSDQHL